MFLDSALYTRKIAPGGRKWGKRAIDRIVPKLPLKRDPLKSAIAARMPNAVFSTFEVEGVHADGGVIARDLLDDGRVIHIMDNLLEGEVWPGREPIVAGRLVDLGPWYVSFGILVPLRKSEALAISLVYSQPDGADGVGRDDLHELVYSAQLHGDNLVMRAVEPMIMALALAIDTDAIDLEDIATSLPDMLSGAANAKDRENEVPLVL